MTAALLAKTGREGVPTARLMNEARKGGMRFPAYLRHSQGPEAEGKAALRFRPIRTLTDGAGGFLPRVPLGCLGMGGPG